MTPIDTILDLVPLPTLEQVATLDHAHSSDLTLAMLAEEYGFDVNYLPENTPA